MRINKIKVKTFRNIESAEIEFSSGVNLLYGNNAQGKTNIIEAIYYFSRGKSFRLASDEELKKIGEDGFSIELEFSGDERHQTLAYRAYGNEKKKWRNGAEEKKMTDMIGYFRAVLFFPEHLYLVKEGPSGRRDFVDVGISQIKPFYMSVFSQYNKILKQRNSILKDAQKGFYLDREQLDSWSEALAQRAAYINAARVDYLKRIEIYAKKILAEISDGKEELSLEYISDASGEKGEIEDKYRELFSSDIQREIAAGCTLFGIHRDDIEIKINGISARHFASQGQQRSIVLALKLAEGEVSREKSGEYPVFLFDDVLSELDEKRRKYVLSEKENRQIIISACDKSEFEQIETNIIKVENGKYVSSYGQRTDP